MGIIGRIIGTVVSIALAAGAYFAFTQWQEKSAEDDAPNVGDCVKMTGASFDADHAVVGCDEPDATYEVVADDGKCDPAEVSYTITLGDATEGNVADLCLVVNAAEGDCFKVGGPTTPDEKVDCAASKGDPTVQQVVAVHDSATGDCPKGSTPLRNKTRDTLMCTSPN